MKTLTERITELEHTVNESITSREKDLGPFIKTVQDLTAGANAMNWQGVASIGSYMRENRQLIDELRTNFSTLTALLGAHDNRMDRMDVSSARLCTEIEGIKSHNVTAQAVCINALNELQKRVDLVQAQSDAESGDIQKILEVSARVESRIHSVATAQDVHKQNLITLREESLTLHALRPTTESVNALHAKLVEVLNIALRLVERVESLERNQLPPSYGPIVPVEIPGPQSPTNICKKEVGDWGMPVG